MTFDIGREVRDDPELDNFLLFLFPLDEVLM